MILTYFYNIVTLLNLLYFRLQETFMRITKQLILPLLILNIFSLSSLPKIIYLEQLELPIDTQELKLTNSYISNNLLSVNFAWNTAFSAIICTKWGCSHSFGLGSSYKVPLIIGEEVCVSVSNVDPLLTASRYNYYFKMGKR